ncbi:PA2778 family cysteine peptidase [Thiovibrio frasassiensis]|uniref:PA2778 family cysteine peptidase n=1 Tax=Thiovibrio frasassiensis TaxID=2984131 RepID=A0A9X4RL35_9BACT|nr:PA2778 family cysteine peptidase [Thiovibrio frasassiensis]MDG4475190.1 PA2778 family cysteine peptidase [Thiovibrio frasassiensis]
MIVGLFFFALPLVLSGCGLLSTGRLPQPANVPDKAMVSGVPFFAQDELQCGPAALAMALNWSGVAIQPTALTPEVFSPTLKGSLQSGLIGAARRHGRVAYPISGSEALLAEVAGGNPVIVLTNLAFSWYPKWHYGVVIGYDQEQSEVILHSGLTANEHLSSSVFLNIWQRSEYWGLLVLPPERLPKRVEEAPWLEAVAGLERTGHWQEAAAGYRAALKRWPKSFGAWMGLGNSRYSLHDLAGAAEAFRKATRLQPKNGIPFNNLAQVLAEQGKRKEALAAAQRAVDLGGPLVDNFRQTQAEIKAKKAKSRPSPR